MPQFLPPQTPTSRFPPHGWDFRLRPPVSPTSPTSFSRGRSFTETTRSWPTPNRLRSPRPPGPIPQCSSQRPLKVSRRRRFSTSHRLRFRLVLGGSFALNNLVISLCASVPAPVVELCIDFVEPFRRLVPHQVYSVHRFLHQLYHVYHLALHQFHRVSQLAQQPFYRLALLCLFPGSSIPLPACSASILPHLSPPASHFFNASHW